MKRYLRLYLYFLRFSFSKAMEFRVDFFFRVVMDSFFYLTQFLFFGIIYSHTNLLGGWTPEQMNIFVCAVIFIDALHMTVFSNNAWWLPVLINKGDLDYYLTKPVSTLFFVSLREFAANSLLNLILAIGLMVWMLSNYTQKLPTLDLFIFFVLLVNGTLLYFAAYLLFIFSVFWTGSPRGFADLYFSASKIFERPDGIFQGIFKKIFTRALPFCMMASYPVHFLLGTMNRSEVIIETITISLLFYFMILQIWKLGLRSYSSASS